MRLILTATWLIALSGSTIKASLVAHYNFTSEPGATATDESATGNNDIPVVGAPTWLASEGERSGVMNFANAGNLRLNPPVDKPANGAAFTVSLWVKSDVPDQNTWSSLFSNGQGGANHFQIDANGGNWRLLGGTYNTPIGPIVDTWTHLAVTWDGTTTSWYFDGALIGTGTTNPGGNFDEFRIATNRANDANGAVDADIDDVQIWDEALDADAIAGLFSSTTIIESFATDAESIASGAPLTLSWEVGEFDTLAIDNGVGDVAPNTTAGIGGIEVMPTVSTTYTLTGTLDGGTQSREVFVQVGEAPIISVFAFVGSSTVPLGGSATLRWATFGETSLHIAPAPGDVTGSTQTTVMPTTTTVYTLSATNGFGTTTAEVTATVREGALIAHYNFTSEPNPTAIDESPGGTNSVDVTFEPTSPVWLAEDTGRTGVLSFDDTPGGQIRLVSPPTIPLPGEGFTVMLWTKSDQPGQTQWGSVFANGQGGTNHFQIDSDGTGNWRLNAVAGASFGPIVDEWTHLALTWDGASRIMYYNGVPVGAPTPSNPGSNFDEYRIGTNRADDANGAVDAEVDDVRVYDFALDAAGVLAAMNDTSEVQGPNLAIKQSGDDLVLTWGSELGKLYTLHSETDPSRSAPIDWPVYEGYSDMPATPPENILTIPMPADPTRLFVVGGFPAPPVILFADDLESGAEGWTTVVNDAIGSTRWELGSPSGSTGPLTGAGDSATAWSTNLGDYGPDSDISLRSPAFDLSGVASAELTFKAFRDTDGFGDSAVVRFLRAVDFLQLGAETAIDMAVFDIDYTSFSIPVVPEAMGENVIIEWTFLSDDSADAFSGLSIDDIEVIE